MGKDGEIDRGKTIFVCEALAFRSFGKSGSNVNCDIARGNMEYEDISFALDWLGNR